MNEKRGEQLYDELRLIRKIQKSGDRESADILIRKYYDEVFRFIRKQTSDDDTALDLTQEIFISLLKTISRYDPKKGASIRTWIYKIATDKTIDYFRSRSAKMIVTLSIDDVEPVDEADFTKRILDEDFAERVCKYVSNFPADTQKIFRLHIFGGYTFSEIGASMKIPEGSIKSKYYRLINKVRGEFSD